jgi:hypothetical protein
VQTYFSDGGCTGTADTEATFGGVNLCQPIRSVLDSVVSVTADTVTDDPAGCVGMQSYSFPHPRPLCRLFRLEKHELLDGI